MLHLHALLFIADCIAPGLAAICVFATIRLRKIQAEERAAWATTLPLLRHGQTAMFQTEAGTVMPMVVTSWSSEYDSAIDTHNTLATLQDRASYIRAAVSDWN